MTRLALLALVACGLPATPVPTLQHAPAPGLPRPNGPRAVAIAQVQPQPLPDDPMGVTIHRLRNGLTVYISTDRTLPTITTHLIVRAGSAYDPHESTGLAHYLEHMLYKGTQRLGTTDYAQEKPHLDRIAQLYAELRRPGADTAPITEAIDQESQRAAAYAIPSDYWNVFQAIGGNHQHGWTSRDHTQFTTTIPKNHLAQWAKLEADRFAHPVFRMFPTELEAVYEEKNRSVDDPWRRTYDAYMAAMYPRHGYGQPLLGEIDHLKRPAYGDMVAFFERYYAPANTALVLCGDVDASVLPLLEQELGAWQHEPGLAHEERTIEPLEGRSEVAVVVPSDEGVWLAWRTVKAINADRDALEIADRMLADEGGGGLLRRDLLQDQRVAEAGSELTFWREAGDWRVHADALAGQSLADVEKLLLATVHKLARGEFSDQDLATAVQAAAIAEDRERETDDGRAAVIDRAFDLGDDWAHVVSRRARYQALTRADIMRVATHYLGDDYLVVKKVKAVSSPLRLAKPKLTPLTLDASRKSALATEILAMRTSPIEPVAVAAGKDYTRTGDTIAVANHRNGLAAVTFAYDFGRIDDRLACFALDLLDHAGIAGKPAADVQRELHALGLTVTHACGKLRSSIAVEGPDANLDAGLALLRAQLGAAVIDGKTLAAAIEKAKTERANQVADPGQLVHAFEDYVRDGASSDELVVATTAQLAATRPAKVQALLRAYLALAHRTSYFGPRAAPDVSLGEATKKPVARPPAKLRTGTGVYTIDLDRAQTALALTWPRPATTPDARALGRLYLEYATWLMWDEVRDARGLAYVTAGGYAPSTLAVDQAALFASASTQADKAHDTLDALLRAVDMPIDPARFARAQQILDEIYRNDRVPPRELGQRLLDWEDQGEPTDPRAARAAKIAATTLAALEAWRKQVTTGPKLISIAGRVEVLDQSKLKQLAPVIPVPASKLFGY